MKYNQIQNIKKMPLWLIILISESNSELYSQYQTFIEWMNECNFKKVMRQETGIGNVHNLLSL